MRDPTFEGMNEMVTDVHNLDFETKRRHKMKEKNEAQYGVFEFVFFNDGVFPFPTSVRFIRAVTHCLRADIGRYIPRNAISRSFFFSHRSRMLGAFCVDPPRATRSSGILHPDFLDPGASVSN